MSNSKNRAVMMLVSRRVKPGYEAEFERLMEQFIDAAANFPGCLNRVQFGKHSFLRAGFLSMG
jgi:antibiotic biosynthesis monooxygenase (ABM) superfamily enzyme